MALIGKVKKKKEKILENKIILKEREREKHTCRNIRTENQEKKSLNSIVSENKNGDIETPSIHNRLTDETSLIFVMVPVGVGTTLGSRGNAGAFHALTC